MPFEIGRWFKYQKLMSNLECQKYEFRIYQDGRMNILCLALTSSMVIKVILPHSKTINVFAHKIVSHAGLVS